MMKAWRLTVGSPSMLRLASRLARLAQRPLARDGRLRNLPPPLSGWTRHRTFPTIASRSFRERWQDGVRDE